MVSVPRLVIAAPASGAGKTTVATGLMAALRARGLQVSPHKVGPDYIDPGYHSLATGRAGRNLDPVLVGENRIVPLFLHGAAGADVAVVEGVMGLFDGRGATTYGSTAHVAKLLAAPVVLVVDGSSQSRSVAALVHGFTTFDPGVRLAGVVLNRVGSDRHENLLREALDGRTTVLGVLRRDAGVLTPSRHLGLVPVAERAPEAVATVNRLATLVRQGCDLDALLALARNAPPLTGQPWQAPASAQGGRPVIAVAGGPAFTFSYAETTELLIAAGADVVVVDPLRDPELPRGTAGLVIGGGFPEVYAEQLSANASLRADVARLAASGAPIEAECAGLLYLCETLDGLPMCGVLPATGRMTDRLTLGYREATGPGGTVTGHEFHRTVVEPRAGAMPAWSINGAPEGFLQNGVRASYLHTHWAGQPGTAARFVAAAQRMVMA
ncbi:MAG: cobyrinate a,c-diamide synthase [Frankiales bacterium]|nr:cobyrinate a,c-diamide synthase [Frankiales bacterium]